MPRPKLPFLHCYKSRHGTWRYYVQLNPYSKGRGVRIGRNQPYRSVEFMAEYHAAVRGTPIVAAPIVSRDSKNTVSWLVGLYCKSRAWTHDLSAGTRKQRGPIYKQMEEKAGDQPLSAVTRQKIEEGMSSRSDNQARHFLNAVSQLFGWAIKHQLFDGRNPCDGIKRPRNDSSNVDDGHLPWPIELIEKYEKRWPLGTRERLILDVYLYIGIRRGDAARLGKQHLRGDLVYLKTEKTQTPIYVPIHPTLAKSIKACPSKGLAVIAKPNGANYTKESLGNIFREAIDKAGIPVTRRSGKEEGEKGYSGHGLRKASAIIAAESGATESELNAMFGWSGHQMARLYTKNADRKKLAARAMAKWARPSGDFDGEFLQLQQEDKEVA